MIASTRRKLMEQGKPKLLCTASSDAEFEEIWQRLSRESRPATPPSAPASPEPPTVEDEQRAAEDELRQILGRERCAPDDPHPPGWGLLTGVEPTVRGRRSQVIEGADVSRSSETAIFFDSEASGARSTPPEPVLATSITGLATAVQAEVARRAERAVLEEQRRANAMAIDGAEAEIERLTEKLAERRADEAGDEWRDAGALTESSDEDDCEDTRVDKRQRQRLRWADMLRDVHSAYMIQTRQKLGAHALWRAVKQEAGEAAPPLQFVDKWVERTGRRKIRPDLPSADFVRDWLADRNGQQRDVADVEQWQRELNSAKATYRRLEQAHQKRPSFSNGEPTDESVEYERQAKELRHEMRQLRANIRAGQIVRREDLRFGSAPPARSAQRPPSLGSVKKWGLLLRETYADLVREHGVAPGVHRLRKELETKCGARLAPHYPRYEEDADLHPWNNDPRQVGTRAPLRSIELHRVPGHLTAFSRIPTTAIGGRPTAILSSNASGRGC